MYAIKTSVIAKEHEPEIEDISILYMDMRTYGKNFEDYFYRAKDEIGVNFYHGRPAEVTEDPETQDLIIKVGHLPQGTTEEIRANMVILCAALVPSKGSAELREILGIGEDNMGFLKEKHLNGKPCDTTRDGIYMCGCCTAPKDIPDSVAEASAAAVRATAEFGNYTNRPQLESAEPSTAEQPAPEITPRRCIRMPLWDKYWRYCECARCCGIYKENSKCCIC
jgi:heterodisulfide reductase subunit A